MDSQAVIVIPARLASTRLPRKLLLDQTGRSVLEHTCRASERSQLAGRVVVAADDEQIAAVVRGFGGEVVLTDPDHVSGTDRVAEVARQLEADLIINVQGDEPEIEPEAIDQVITLLREQPDIPVATLATPIRDRGRLEDPACVKVVRDHAGQAMYFSRSVIPHPRTWDDAWLSHQPPVFLQHVGLYGYRRNFLTRWSNQPPVPIEQMERLEQLRMLEAGIPIRVGLVDHAAPGIDTPEDYAAFVSRQGY